MRTIFKATIGVGAAAVAAAAAYVLQERRTPEPDFTVQRRDGAIELRRYNAILTAEVTVAGPRDEALEQGFRRLAGYIFAKSRGGEKIAMTVPVIQDREEKIAMTAPVLQDGSGGQWRTRFVMPAKYSRATLPPPPDGVTIGEVPARLVAVVRFAGRADDTMLADHEGELRAWLSQQGLEPAGPAEFAFYNSPVIPSLLRRNEILIPLNAAA